MNNDNNFEKTCQAVFAEGLVDKKFGWSERKMETLKLARLYELAEMPLYAERAAACSTYLQFATLPNRERELLWGNFCQLRLCPLCMARRARSAANRLSLVMDAVEAETDCEYIFLTLTLRNVTGKDLQTALRHLTASWHRLMRQRPVQAVVQGWFRSLEITRGIDGTRHPDKGYHPHIHAILAVKRGYARRDNEQYIKHADWVVRWQKAAKVDYKPVVDIRKTRSLDPRKQGKGAVLEAAKYVVKSAEYISPKLSQQQAVERVAEYTNALYRTRLTAFGGTLKDMALRLKIGDLDADDALRISDYVRLDLVDMIETYQWHFGVHDYILADRRYNSILVDNGAEMPVLV